MENCFFTKHLKHKHYQTMFFIILLFIIIYSNCTYINIIDNSLNVIEVSFYIDNSIISCPNRINSRNMTIVFDNNDYICNFSIYKIKI